MQHKYIILILKITYVNNKHLNSLFVCTRTISVMQVNIDIKDSFIFLPQPEDAQHGIINVTET